MLRRILAASALVLALAGCAPVAPPAPAPVATPTAVPTLVVLDPVRVPVPAVPPCAQEDDARPCYWHADERTNGRGVSFTVDGAGVAHPWGE
jgi:hypothetical protein